MLVLCAVTLAASSASFHHHDANADTIYQAQCATCQFSNHFHKLNLNKPAASFASKSFVTYITISNHIPLVLIHESAVRARAPPLAC